MKLVLQRAGQARVSVDGAICGEIGTGFCIFLGVSDTDTEEIADKVADKICKLRIFEDQNGKTNLSLTEAAGELLIISQFTLYADCRKGNRPSFTGAGSPDHARKLYEYFIEKCREKGFKTECGIFGAEMKVEITNDGPFTLMLDSRDLFA